MENYLVIGGSSGIGEAIVSLLSKKKESNVLATYNSKIPFKKDNVQYHNLNVEIDFDLDFLPEKIDGLVYCPGLINLIPFSRLTEEVLINDFNVQVTGAIKVIQRCLPRLKKSDKASVILFSSVAVQQGFNFHSLVSISKGAIEGLTRSLASELSPKIRVNAIAPSITKTPLTSKLLSSENKINANAERPPLKRIGDPEDIAELAKFLISSKSSWITGQIISVDGGLSNLKM